VKGKINKKSKPIIINKKNQNAKGFQWWGYVTWEGSRVLVP
jgi:hypothetical protein